MLYLIVVYLSLTSPLTLPWNINHSTEKNLVEHKEKIPDDVKAEVQKAIDDVKAVQDSEDVDDIKAKVETLQVRESPARVPLDTRIGCLCCCRYRTAGACSGTMNMIVSSEGCAGFRALKKKVQNCKKQTNSSSARVDVCSNLLVNPASRELPSCRLAASPPR